MQSDHLNVEMINDSKSEKWSCSVMSDSLQPNGLCLPRPLHPWDFSRQGYWSRLPFPSSWDLPDRGIEPGSPALQTDSTIWATPGKPSKSESSNYRQRNQAEISASTWGFEEAPWNENFANFPSYWLGLWGWQGMMHH